MEYSFYAQGPHNGSPIPCVMEHHHQSKKSVVDFQAAEIKEEFDAPRFPATSRPGLQSIPAEEEENGWKDDSFSSFCSTPRSSVLPAMRFATFRDDEDTSDDARRKCKNFKNNGTTTTTTRNSRGILKGRGGGHKLRPKKEQGKVRRLQANARERKRMHGLKEAFDLLRERLPAWANDRQMSKYDTLLMAQTYIVKLQEILADQVADSDPQHE
ncbi:hypothetical protein BV898_15520 [Hypsibius exemplaris]|uniref:BHLH domain-containing protein n=1 Tax=Hypsibius exemplaris TaxID=2072580 RepID=A0A9X6RKB2_HYPEX|nr:hypothetical protein BV898_15520 [Hypsibius exemplaris]